MHLRGPINVSQLAVYQLPSEMHSLRKRNTVPFYNRRQPLKQRDGSHMTDETTGRVSTSKTPWVPFFNKRCETTTSCTQLTVTSTITVTDCTTSATVEPRENITYIGPPVPCLPTSEPLPVTANDPPLETSCGCNTSTVIGRHHSYPTLAPTTAVASTVYTDTVWKRDDVHVADSAPDWSRVAYYVSTAPAQATGLSFLANLGDPQKSGTFD